MSIRLEGATARARAALHAVRSDAVLLGSILAIALAVRLWYLRSGVPFAVGIDEPAIVDRALRILHTGDWNTHVFDYPPAVIYLHAIVAIVRFLAGAALGEWASLDQFQIASVYAAGRAVAALAGAATVWVTFRLGRDVESPLVGLVAAAQLAVVPLHVRESHYILTDVPVTFLTTVSVWLAVRASSIETAGAYATAGAAAGVATAAKYNGIVAIVPLLVVWLFRGRTRVPAADRRLAVALGGMLGAFVIAAPYVVLDLPAFLNGFAAQASRFATGRMPGDDPAWAVYMRHLSLAGIWWMPLAVYGLVMGLVRRRSRTAWLAVSAFALAYFAVLATHAPVFARYALPIVPIVCLAAAKGIVEAGRGLLPARRRRWQGATVTVLTLFVMTSFLVQTIAWLDRFRRADTRALAADWLMNNVPPGTCLVVENSGPTYLASARFVVGAVEVIVDYPIAHYRAEGAEYLVISSIAGLRDRSYADAGPVTYEIAPGTERWGPEIRIIRIR